MHSLHQVDSNIAQGNTMIRSNHFYEWCFKCYPNITNCLDMQFNISACTGTNVVL